MADAIVMILFNKPESNIFWNDFITISIFNEKLYTMSSIYNIYPPSELPIKYLSYQLKAK